MKTDPNACACGKLSAYVFLSIAKNLELAL